MKTDSPTFISLVECYTCLIISKPFGFWTVKEEKKRTNDPASKEDISNFPPKITSIRVNDIGYHKSNEPAKKHLAHEKDSLHLCTKRESTDFRREGDANGAEGELFGQSPSIRIALGELPYEFSHNNNPLGSFVSDWKRAANPDYKTSNRKGKSSCNNQSTPTDDLSLARPWRVDLNQGERSNSGCQIN